MHNQFVRVQASQMSPHQSSTSSTSSIGQQLEKISLDEQILGLRSLESVEKLWAQAIDYPFEENNPFKGKQFFLGNPFSEGMRKLGSRKNNIESALLFELAVQKSPRRIRAWSMLSSSLDHRTHLEKKIKAEKMYLNLEKRDGSFVDLPLVRLLMEANKHKEACRHLLVWLLNQSKYREQVVGSLDEFDQLSSSEFSELQLDYAKGKFLEAARIEPNSPDWRVQDSLAVLFEISGDKEKAKSCRDCANDSFRYKWTRNVKRLNKGI